MKKLFIPVGFLAAIVAFFVLSPSAIGQVNPSYQQFNTNHFLTNGSPWKIAIKTNQTLTINNLTVVSNAIFGDIFYATNIANFYSNVNVAVNVYISNSLHVASNAFISNNIHVASNIFLGGTNITNFFTTGSLYEYTNTSPTGEGVFPTASNRPAIAYKRDGTDISYTWDTVVFTWR